MIPLKRSVLLPSGAYAACYVPRRTLVGYAGHDAMVGDVGLLLGSVTLSHAAHALPLLAPSGCNSEQTYEWRNDKFILNASRVGASRIP